MQRGATRRVEVREHLIEQQHRCQTGHVREQPGMRQYDTNEERLLLAGRGFGCGNALLGMGDGEIGEVRTFKRAPGSGVARAILTQHRTIAILDLDRWMHPDHPFHPAIERDCGGRERGARRAARREHGL